MPAFSHMCVWQKVHCKEFNLTRFVVLFLDFFSAVRIFSLVLRFFDLNQLLFF